MEKQLLPLIPVRDVVIFPGSVAPISIKREQSIAALEEALATDKEVFLTMQKNKEVDSPSSEDLYLVGTVAKIDQIQRLPDGIINVLVTGVAKAKIKAFVQETPFFRVDVEEIEEKNYSREEIAPLIKPLMEQFRKLVALGKPIPLEILPNLNNLASPITAIDIIISNLDTKSKDKQALLEENDLKKRIKTVQKFVSDELSVLSTARKIQDQTAEEIGKTAKEAFLREQLKTIEKELGMKEEKEEYAELEKKIRSSGMPPEVETKALKELDRLKRVPAFSPEVSYIRTYLDLLVDLPWGVKSESEINVSKAEKILNEDHYGLKKVKERILEYLAVKKLTGKIRGPILCFAGPPGVGKTSIGRSIAKAMNRKFVKVSLGGIRDEAEIRGHRRTYVGALPGRIIQGIKDAETKNPVFMLDEIDKLGFDFRGDPSSALLEALDPEQNTDFSDHYLEVPFDLSDVVFITTANNLDTIPPALRDRMEVIDFPGYTEEEKLHIAEGFLLPKQIENHGLTEKQIVFKEDALKKIITKYTREAGVRNLEREVSAVCRKV
ncbi:MAG TPA: endopeptidase La, partial [Candidatus Saccharimonadales bacterium]|nr:endopeptidase La [Candidatus Saccharimonadales bacterium]